MRLRRACQLLALTTPVVFPRDASSELPPKALSLVYGAPAGCPSEHDFEQRVRSRVREPMARDASAATLRIQIAVSGGRHVGRFSLIEPDGRSTSKTLNGADCEELVDALSLVVALAIDSDEKAKAAESGEPPPKPPASAEPLTPPGALEQERLRRTPSSSPFGVGLGGMVAVGPAPSVLLGGTLNVEWRPFGATGFAPAFGIELAAAESLDEARPGGTASFTWLNVRTDACLVRLAIGPALALRGCFLGAVGLVRARGSNTLHPMASSRGWLSVGGAIGLEAPLGSRLALHGMLGVEAPFRRDSYAFGADQFFTVPEAIGTAAISLLAYFP